MKTQEIHEQVLNIYLEHKKNNPDFTFSPRVKGERLYAGYWFQGNENYLFSAPFNRGDNHNMTKTIGYVLKLDEGSVTGSYVEVVFGHHLNLEIIDFYIKVLDYLGIKYEEGRYKYQKHIKGDWKAGLIDFLEKDVENIKRIISEFDLEDDFIVPESTLQRRLNKIEDIKQRGLKDLSSDSLEVTQEAQSEASGQKTFTNIKQQTANIILYGPPGTGKTYSTKFETLKIIEGQPETDLTREEVNQLFEDYIESGQVVFTTFHQSMSYEDFVEGIKPIIDPETDQMIYKVKNGLFKSIANQARENYISSNTKGTASKDLHIKKLIDSFTQHIERKLEAGPIPLTEKVSITDIDDESLRYRGDTWGGQKGNKISFSELEYMYRSGVETRQEVKRLKDISGLGNQHASYFIKALQLLKLFEKESFNPNDQGSNDEELKQFVIIIDEINRGNVASIFGELITLIEPDKRYGADESLSLVLPYSKERFSVPPNLHIIGTMNTADRSVEALDTALRRRFIFNELMTDYSLVSNDPYLEISSFILSKHSDDIESKKVIEQWDDLIHWLNFEGADKSIINFEKFHRDFSTNDKLMDYRKDPGYQQLVKSYFNSQGVEFNPIRLDRLLSTLNKRLTYLLDRDHTIGHSFFMGINSLSKLRRVFKNQVIPQLKEYFYGDWSKIGMVLGNRFIKEDTEKLNWPAGFDNDNLFDDYQSLVITDNWSISDFQSIYQVKD